MIKIKDLSMIEMLMFAPIDRQIQGGEGLSISVGVLGIEGLDSQMSKSLHTTLNGTIISMSVFSMVKTIPGGMTAVSRSSSSIATIPVVSVV